jgi:hypothetical protein
MNMREFTRSLIEVSGGSEGGVWDMYWKMEIGMERAKISSKYQDVKKGPLMGWRMDVNCQLSPPKSMVSDFFA